MNEQKLLLKQQRNEITEYLVYLKLASMAKLNKNSKILKRIAKDELEHYNFLKGITKRDVSPSKLSVYFYMLIAKILSISFSLRLMERNEGDAQTFYNKLSKKYPNAKKIAQDELRHEKDLIGILNDEKLEYASSIVLGLNDALVELTGTLAGLTIALKDTKTIAITGVVLGFAASMSMAASEYLSTKEDRTTIKRPIKSAGYTGFAYLLTVVILITPYLLIENHFEALGIMLALAVVIIASYNYAISVAKAESFSERFWQMIFISFGVAIISFIFGYFVDKFFL